MICDCGHDGALEKLAIINKTFIMPDFLLEIGCEEIPARMIDAASEELRERVAALLSRERLSGGEVTHFDTPRRLAVMASGIAASQADVTEAGHRAFGERRL